MADHGQRIRSADSRSTPLVPTHTLAPDERHARRGSPDDASPSSPWRPRDACGVGFIAQQSGERSHEVTRLALEAVSRVAHRGASSTDKSGDGAGLLTQIPYRLFRRDADRWGGVLAPGQPFAVGMFFLPVQPAARTRAAALIERVLAADALPLLGWREVPVDPMALGSTARASMPYIAQVLVGQPAGMDDPATWERALYLARREMEREAAREGLAPFYCCSMSCRTIVYKAMLTGSQLPRFYTDFKYPEFETAIAVFHERYATNTQPSWELAQPFRLLAHNGEINTLWGNRNAMTMRQPMLATPAFGDKSDRVRDVIDPRGSDSTSLDNAMELLVRAGRTPVHAGMMLVPEAWEKYPDVDSDVKAFYEYHQCVIEPWDGPAALAFSDGVTVAAAVDRNGLRPCRYKIRSDGMIALGSEVGLVDFDPREVVETGKLGSGESLLVDTQRKLVLRSLEAKREIATRKPYAKWVARYMATLPPSAGEEPLVTSSSALLPMQLAFGYGFEDVRMVLEPMGGTGADAVWSMGDDTPIPPLSTFPQGVYAYFRQRFAQVTNPPIDSLRETQVMSLRMHLGRRGSPLEERPSHARMLRVEHPVLLPDEMRALRDFALFDVRTLDATFAAADGPGAMLVALGSLSREAEQLVRRGARILIVSDRLAGPTRAPIPMLLALGAVRQHLIAKGLRARVGLVAEAGDAFDPHHVAALVGYGAEAVHPWLAMETVAAMYAEAPEHGRRDVDATQRPLPAEALARYRSAIEKGLLKVLAKMGIATLSSFCGAQIFEALGLGAEVIDRCFAGTVSPLGGLGFAELAADVMARHQAAWPHVGELPHSLPDYGRVRFRKDGEDHGWAPGIVVALQRATGSARSAGISGDEAYRDFLSKNGERRASGPRDLLRFTTRTPIPLDEVEPVEAIRQRFVSSAMSLGALSPEAHATISIAMNRMGARSNSGEGGEDARHYASLPNGDRADNRIKQVASGRFGVTTEYLARAEELEIKIVQGAKPGEGGQLPAHKVTELIARLRHSVPGVSLISPPPHHDIYSIEDLAQLVHDLKTVNPRARIGVKLVAEAGVGTVAAGVAKAFADYVLIAGYNGGTGASPLSSIKHAGSPWELGLAETQQVLVKNGLRHRIEVRVDGGFKTGRDVVIGALLGAESFGFGTAPLVALGCAMARQCHLNTCPTGIASQRDDLRAKFRGTPEQVVAYFTHVAEEVREILASLGVRRLQDIVGRADYLEREERPERPRAALLDLSFLLTRAERAGEPAVRTVARNERPPMPSLDEQILRDAEPFLGHGLPFSGHYNIRNHHLTVGARVAGTIAERHGDAGLPAESMHLRFSGSAGQSFGAFTISGMHLDLEGEANDYLGKGLSGGELTLRPFREALYARASHEHLILGNTALYGATAGRVFAAGQAGDRFAVRNSGAVAVIEGAGNHCCEYMTGGIVAVLGRTGRNFGAGMSNGVAYVLDERGDFAGRVNHDMVLIGDLDHEDRVLLHALVREHRDRTMSLRARTIIAKWEWYLPLVRKVKPRGASEHVAEIRRRYLDRYVRPAVASDATLDAEVRKTA
ncbi:MAG: glutamate synthase large subunit [Gemmatimonadetes bacterium]|nr:glutamate synthase large subunit [Gemmatimonadota bacterium]